MKKKEETLKIRVFAGEKRKILKIARELGFFQIRNGKKEVNLSEYARRVMLRQI